MRALSDGRLWHLLRTRCSPPHASLHPDALKRMQASKCLRRWFSGTGSMPLLDELRARGMVSAVTSETLRDHLSQPRCVYAGFDPTADSLHLGNFVVLATLARLQQHGHRIVCLVRVHPLRSNR